MNFISFAQFYEDIARWEKQLPQFDAVCGVPRSGLIPASYISLKRNIRMVSLDQLFNNYSKAIEQAPIRSNNPIAKNTPGNRLLVIDDATSDDSVTFKWLQKAIEGRQGLEVVYGCVYRASEKSLANLFYRTVPQPRLFEWNWLRNWRLNGAIFDCDGALCADWKHRPEQEDDEEFLAHVNNAAPVYIPQVPITAIVTSRLEKYREPTKRWLAKHGVRYHQLIMHPAKTPQERRKMQDHADRKAAAYTLLKSATIFVESDVNQAAKIYEITKKPVLATDNMQFFKG